MYSSVARPRSQGRCTLSVTNTPLQTERGSSSERVSSIFEFSTSDRPAFCTLRSSAGLGLASFCGRPWLGLEIKTRSPARNIHFLGSLPMRPGADSLLQRTSKHDKSQITLAVKTLPSVVPYLVLGFPPSIPPVWYERRPVLFDTCTGLLLLRKIRVFVVQQPSLCSLPQPFMPVPYIVNSPAFRRRGGYTWHSEALRVFDV